MCLFSSQKTPLIANEDILCYKILIPVDGNFVTPYRDFIFNINKIIQDKEEECIREIFGMTEVTSGFFHSFITKERVLEEIKILQRKLPTGTKLKVFKAIIPKGYSYYVGQRSDMCSKALIILE